MRRSSLTVTAIVFLSVLFGGISFVPEARALTWMTETVDSLGDVGEFASLALDSMDRPHIAYRDSTNGSLKYARWTGSNWEIETVDSADRECISLAVDRNNRPHISYHDGVARNLRYAHWDGVGWIRQTVDSVDSNGMYSSIALDSNDRPHISYHVHRLWALEDLMYAKKTGPGWVTMVADGVPDVGEHTSLELDSNDYPHISYSYHGVMPELMYIRWTPSGWIEEPFLDLWEGTFTSLELDSNDYAHIAYYRHPWIWYTYWNGTAWHYDSVVDSRSSALSLALNDSDYPHLSYVDHDDVYYSVWNGTDWVAELVDHVGGAGAPGVSLALDSSGSPHIAYRDLINLDLKYAKSIDPTPPTVVSKSPEGVNVPLSTNIKVTFSRAMNEGQTESAFSISPSVSGSFSWLGETLTFTPSSNLSQLTTYSVTINASMAEDLDRNKLDGNGNGSPEGSPIDDYSWEFSTSVDLAPTIEVWDPGGTAGQAYTQQIPVEIRWTAADDYPLPSSSINISYGSAPTWTTIATDEQNDGTFIWDTSSVPCPGTYWMNLSVRDANLQTTYGESNYSFDIRCPSAPGPPLNLSAELVGPNHQDLLVSWSRSKDDGAGENNVMRYDIFQSSSVGGPYMSLFGVPADGSASYAWTCAGCGEGDPSNYFFYVESNTSLLSTPTEHKCGKFTRQLGQGPNLISVPLIQSDESIEQVLQTVQYDRAWSYDSVSQEWIWYMTGKDYRRGLWSVNHTMGFWVNVMEDSNLTVAGIVPVQTAIHLREGWNLVGYPSFNATYTAWWVKAATGATRMEGHNPLPPHHLRVLGDGDALWAGHAYWALVGSDTIWTVSVG